MQGNQFIDEQEAEPEAEEETEETEETGPQTICITIGYKEP